MDLSRLMAPRSVAVIAGRYAEPALHQLRRIGFAGRIHVVSPTRATIGGIATVATVGDLPGSVDCAFLAIPAEACPAAVATLAGKDCGGVVCFASEFAETGHAERQESLVRAAGIMPLLGPNGHGLVNGLDRVALWPDEHGVRPIDRGVAILSQSGNIAINLTMQERSVPIAVVVGLGNQAQLDATAFLRWCATEPRITALGLHLEGLADPAAFAEAARALGKPMVALKTGRSAAGARATVTHTSTLAGSDAAYDALFARCGIGRVRSPASFLEALKVLHVLGRRPGRRIASLSCSGGEAALVADLAEAHGLVTPPLSPAATREVATALEGRVSPDNPLDYHTFQWGDGLRLTRSFTAMLRGAEVDTGLLVLDYPTRADSDPASWDVTLDAWIEATRAAGRATAVVASLPECLPAQRRERLIAAGIAPLQGLGDAIEALAAAATPEPSEPQLTRAPALRNGPRRTLVEAEAKRLLRGAGVAVPEGAVVSGREAPAQARRIGFPVVLKAAADGLAHKTEAGGVALGLADVAAVEAAVAGMAHLGDRFLVERMVRRPVAELIVGIVHEPGFGPVLTIGAGGVLAELTHDTATLLLPTSYAAVEAALRGLKVGRLLGGWRGGPAGDVTAAAAAVVRMAELAFAEADRLVELEVNPLMVLADGQGAVAADALMVVVDEAGE